MAGRVASFPGTQQKSERITWYPLFTHAQVVLLHSPYNSLRYVYKLNLQFPGLYSPHGEIFGKIYVRLQCAANLCRNVSCKSVMAICHFCLSRVDATHECIRLMHVYTCRSHTNTNTSLPYRRAVLRQLFILQCHSWLSNLNKGTRHRFVEPTI